MEIIAHRGFWISAEEKNTQTAFLRALENGFGIETDLRDFDGTLVISHDMANAQCLSVDDFLKMVSKTNPSVSLALNIKADGLCQPLKALLARYTANSFVFDMSIPDTLGYLRLGFTTYLRQSEYECEPAFYDKAAGIWLDCFERDWFDHATIMRHIDAGKKVCVVSPELHKRDYQAVWQMLRALIEEQPVGNRLALCTDFPQDAQRFFNGAA